MKSFVVPKTESEATADQKVEQLNRNIPSVVSVGSSNKVADAPLSTNDQEQQQERTEAASLASSAAAVSEKMLAELLAQQRQHILEQQQLSTILANPLASPNILPQYALNNATAIHSNIHGVPVGIPSLRQVLQQPYLGTGSLLPQSAYHQQYFMDHAGFSSAALGLTRSAQQPLVIDLLPNHETVAPNVLHLGAGISTAPKETSQQSASSRSESSQKSASLEASLAKCTVKMAFPEKLYFMMEALEKEGKDDICGYVAGGQAVMIHSSRDFEKDIMPLYFASTRITSIQRQFNIYGFERVQTGVWRGAYRHKYFQRGKKELLQKIVRTRTKTSGKNKPAEES